MRVFLWLSLSFWFAFCLWLIPSGARAEEGGKKQGAAIAVIDFDYIDTSGEVRDQRKEHDAQLAAFMHALKGDLGERGGFRIAKPACVPEPCAAASSTVADLLTAARQAGADILLIGGIQKMSTLVQWAKVQAIDAGTGRVILDKLFTFRGDTDEAWRRAETFIAGEVTGLELPANTDPSPVKIVVFDFELDDFSAAAGIAGDAAADLAHLDRATDEVRRLISGSGRYRLVDVSNSEVDAVKSRSLRQCNGCEAAIASKLGADQSLIGVVTRISRTEYTVRFQTRDAHTGAPVLARQSDLRIGADYSWNRGAVSLIKNTLLDKP
jgi:hypothetical protein